MFVTTIFLAVFAATRVVFSTPIQPRPRYSIKESHRAPQKWTRLGRAPRSRMLSLQIGVKQSQFETLERHLYEVSDPNHTRYGKHLSLEDINELVKPTDESLNLVQEWLLAHGITEMTYSAAKDWINIRIDVALAETLLDTEYHVFEHEDGTQLARTQEWSLPEQLHSCIDTIQPTTSWMRHVPEKFPLNRFGKAWIPPKDYHPSNSAISAVCSMNGTTPECFKTLYQTLGYKQKVPGINHIGFNNFVGEVPIRPDAAQFLKLYEPEAISGAYGYQFVDIAGGPSQDGPLTAAELASFTSIEANLDAQTILGQTYPMPVTAYSTGGAPPQIGDAALGSDPDNEPYLTWVNYVLGQKNPPQVISTSYGDDEQTVPIDYAKRVCASFAQLGARGISLFFASGDGGVGGFAGDSADSCISNDGKDTFKFIATFPASCPFVTTVGATQGFEPEVAGHQTDPFGGSGAGFSEYFSRPAYQDKVVSSYIKSLKGEHAGLFNSNGRGYPDIAAQGLNFEFVWNGTLGVVSGTSAATPLVASVIALVNDALISSGRPPMGFLNPWLYSKGYQGFVDVLSGISGGCNTTGFPATEGWDAVTGFGTPIFPKIVALARGES